MYQYEVRPRPGRGCAGQPANCQQRSSIIRNYSIQISSLLTAFHRSGKAAWRIACVLMTGCLAAVLSACGGVTFNPASSQGGSQPAAALTLISCGVQSLTGAQNRTCSVYLSAAATTSTPVALSSSDAALKLPASVVVETGAKSADFTAVTEAVAKSVRVTIAGKADGVTETDVITVNPAFAPDPISAPTLKEFSCVKQSLTGPATIECSILLNSAATHETVVNLSSSSDVLRTPKSVSVAPGKISVSFSVTASEVNTTQKVTLSAAADTVSRTQTILIYPAATSSPVATLSRLSCSMETLVGPATTSCSVYLSQAMKSKKSVTLTSSSGALRTPTTVSIPAGTMSASFTVTASAVKTAQKVTLTAYASGVKQTATITLSPKIVATLSSLSCGTQSLSGTQTKACTVSLSAPAMSQTPVTLSSSNSALKVPSSVTVATGSSSAAFNIRATAVKATTIVTLTAASGGVKKTETFTLSPTNSTPGAAAKLNGLSCGTQSLTGAQTKACTVSLSAAAPGSMLVILSSSSGALHTPASVTVASGQTTAAFNITTSAVSTSQKATLTATADGVAQAIVITLYPAQAATPTLNKISCGTQTLIGPTTEPCSVFLSSAALSPTVVLLSSNKTALQVPASVTIAAGSTSAGFSAKALVVTKAVTATVTATSNGVSLTDVFQLTTSSTQSSTTQHAIQLNWDPPSSASDTITGYNVYRTTGSGSDYSVLSSVDTQTSFTDSTVQSGTTYQYVVKSVDANGVESVPSSPVSVTVP
jgi:trimeric autotransporter adhesin